MVGPGRYSGILIELFFHLLSDNVFFYLRVIYFIGLSVSHIRVSAVFPGRFCCSKKKNSPFLRVLRIMLCYENVIVMLMSLEVGKNSGTAILFLSAIIYALIVFFLYNLFSPPRYSELVRNTLLAQYPTPILDIELLITQHMGNIF